MFHGPRHDLCDQGYRRDPSPVPVRCSTISAAALAELGLAQPGFADLLELCDRARPT